MRKVASLALGGSTERGRRRAVTSKTDIWANGSGVVACVHFNPTNPRQLVSGSYDKTIRLWDVDSGKELMKLEGHR